MARRAFNIASSDQLNNYVFRIVRPRGEFCCALPAGAALVEYRVLRDRIVAWVITPERFETRSGIEIDDGRHFTFQLTKEVMDSIFGSSEIERKRHRGRDWRGDRLFDDIEDD